MTGFELAKIDATKPLGVQFKETVEKIFTYDWIFSQWYEKIIVALSVCWGLYSIGRIIWGLF